MYDFKEHNLKNMLHNNPNNSNSNNKSSSSP